MAKSNPFRTFLIVSDPKDRSGGYNEILKIRGFSRGQKETREEFYRRVDRAEKKLEKKYPGAKIFKGGAVSSDALLNVYPEALLGN